MDAQQSYFLSMLLIAASLGIAAGVIGSAWVLILTEPGQVFGWLKVWLYDKVYDITSKFTKDPAVQYKWETYLLNPIVGCELCVSGQIALWTYLITQPFHIFGLIFSICLSILTAKTIAQLMK